MDFTKTISFNPQNPSKHNQYDQSVNTVRDHEPRRSFSHSTTDTSNRKRGAHNCDLATEAKHPNDPLIKQKKMSKIFS